MRYSYTYDSSGAKPHDEHDKDLLRLVQLTELVQRYELLTEFLLKNWRPALTEESITELLEANQGNAAEVARQLGVSVNGVFKAMRRLGIRRPREWRGRERNDIKEQWKVEVAARRVRKGEVVNA